MRCPICSQEHPDNTQYCPVTGQPIVQARDRCPNCWAEIQRGATFCPFCGFHFVGAGRSHRLSFAGRLPYIAAIAVIVIALITGWILIRPKLAAQNLPALPTLVGKVSTQPQNQRPTAAPTMAPTINQLPTEAPTMAPTDDQLPTEAPTMAPTDDQLPTEAPPANPAGALPPAASQAGPLAVSWIAFTSDRGGSNDIYLMDFNGQHIRQITDSNSDERIPAWSPDGSQLAYQSNQDGDYEIFVIDLISHATRQITHNNCGDYAPTFSPQGDRLAYYSDCDGNREIYTIGLDGREQRQLTETTQVYNWFPAWSPDGREITFSSNRKGKYQVFRMEADGGVPQAVTLGCVSSYSPDGGLLLFSAYCSDMGDLFTYDLNDGEQVTLTYDDQGGSNPAWSSDGEYILFQSDRSGNSDIWRMEADGTSLVQLTDDPGHDSTPVCQPYGG